MSKTKLPETALTELEEARKRYKQAEMENSEAYKEYTIAEKKFNEANNRWREAGIQYWLVRKKYLPPEEWSIIWRVLKDFISAVKRPRCRIH